MIKAGIIGNGGIARSHLRGYSRLFEEGEVEVVAFCDFRPERLEDEFLNVFTNARKYTDIDEMLKAEQGKLDYIDICLPTYLHAEIAIKAMEAGYDVMSEKPMARTVEQAESMVEASKRTGKRLMIAYCNRFNLAAQTIKEIIDSGEFGKPVSAQFQRHGGTYDILRNGKKVCGILTECRTEENGMKNIVIGIGINLKEPIDGFPKEIRDKAGYADYDGDKICLAESIVRKIGDYIKFDSIDVVNKYTENLAFLGQMVTVTDYSDGNKRFDAEVLGVNNDCFMRIRLKDGSERLLSSGEILS